MLKRRMSYESLVTLSERGKRTQVTFLSNVIGVVVLLDQLTKYLVVKFMPLNSGKVVIPGFFNLIHVHNPGAAFSLLAGADSRWRTTFFIILTLVMLTVLYYAYKKTRQDDILARTAYALVMGGALGNLIDRARLGEVVDFLDFYVGSYHWPAFNVADSAISVGAVLLIISVLREQRGQTLKSQDPQA